MQFTRFPSARDRRPRLFEPPPVSLVAIADVQLPGVAGLELAFDDFYVGVLQLMRDGDDLPWVYRAENFRLIVTPHEMPRSQGLCPLGVVVPSLEIVEQRLREHAIGFLRQHHLAAGGDCLLLRDPAGNWVQIEQSRPA